MATNKPIWWWWWCEPGFLPGVTALRAEVRLEDGARLYGSDLIPNNAERFVLEDAIISMKYDFEHHLRTRVR